MKQRELSHATALVLLVLDGLDRSVTQTELAREIDIEGLTLVRLLDQLERQGHIERRPADRRAKTGQTSTAGIQVDLDTLRTGALARVSQADLEAALRVFAAIGALEGHEPAARIEAAEATE